MVIQEKLMEQWFKNKNTTGNLPKKTTQYIERSLRSNIKLKQKPFTI